MITSQGADLSAAENSLSGLLCLFGKKNVLPMGISAAHCLTLPPRDAAAPPDSAFTCSEIACIHDRLLSEPQIPRFIYPTTLINNQVNV